MTQRISAAMVFCTLLTPTLATEPKEWDFHGLVLGSSEKSVKKSFPEFSFSDDGPIRRGSAFFRFDKHPGFLSDNGGNDVHLVFSKDKLVNIHIMCSPTAFDGSIPKLTKTYGKPLEDKKVKVHTKDGRILENRIVTWNSGASTVRYEKYWEAVSISRILYLLKE